jgi:dienelactone hydrolase
MAKYMIWDGIRSLDYLVSRVEVDPERIGITGRSGGGTQSVYISAFDDRILASAPECYVNSFRYLLKSIGPQDAEQNLPHFLKYRLDFADYLEVRAPKPTLIISTLNDFFSIQGARDTYTEVQAVYKAFDQPDNIQMSEDVAEHKSTIKNREAMYAFFQKHLDNPGDPKDINVTIFEKKELNVTQTGQILTEFQGETVFSLNQKESIKIIEKRNEQHDQDSTWNNHLKNKIIDLTGYEEQPIDDKYIFSGVVTQNNLTIEKYLISSENHRKIPVVIMLPDSVNLKKAILILNAEGKAAEIKSGLSEYFARKGYYVIMPDLTGVGELASETQKGDSYISHSSYNKWYAGILTGKSIVGLRMEDIRRVKTFINHQYEIEQGNLSGIARDEITSDLLHAAHVNGGFNKIALFNPLISYGSVVLNNDYDPRYIQSSIYSVLKEYDLPDLAAEWAPKKMLMVNLKDQTGNSVEIKPDNADLNRIMDGYQKKKVEDNLEIISWDGETYDVIFNRWLE